MSDPRTLQPGPWLKSPAWRGGAFLLGFAFLLIIIDWVVGSFIDIGVGRFLVALVAGGVALSAPYGLGLGRKPAPVRAAPAPEWVPQARVQGNVYYKVIEMAAGAMITGRMVHGEVQPQKQLPKPEAVKKAREEAA